MVELLRSQHALGIEMLYEHTGAAVYGILDRISANKKVTEQLMVQTFLHAWQKAPTIPADHPNPLAWILDIAVQTIETQLKSGELDHSQINPLPDLSKEMASNGYKSPLWQRLEQSTTNGLYEEARRNNIPEDKLQYAVLAIRTRMKINESIFQQ